MRLPRRVPWTAVAELDQICSWIFADENDLDTKVLAINRLSAWRAITSLPHALESALALLVVIFQDNSPQTSCSYLSLRQSYATAIIRLVNGLVDPLQLGTYARSIASIAVQLGLPLWLVELRHAATHEDLPSLELLREAARESMSWLLHHYFLPTINPSTARAQSATLRPLEPILKQYKSLLKITSRDASLRTQYNLAINTILKDIERWIAEAKVAANVDVGEFGWDICGPSENLDTGDQDVKERWALERFCDALLEKGTLVPLSKKKRVFPTDSFSPPKFSVLLWGPLLTHLQSLHPGLRTLLSNRIVSYLLSDIQPADVQAAPDGFHPDISFDMCLARWVVWLIDTWEDTESDFELQKEVTVTLITAFGPGERESSRDRKAALALLTALCSGNSDMEAALATLLHPTSRLPCGEWDPNDADVMDKRLYALLSLDAIADAGESRGLCPQPIASEDVSNILAPGWQLLNERTGWKPCPIGVYSAATL